MKVHLLTKKTIKNYVLANAQCKYSFAKWLTTLKNADWNIPSDIKSTYAAADMLGGGTNRVVFNIGGNNYRMICEYTFGTRQIHLFICWIGTHSEYNELCAHKKQYTVMNY